MTPLQKVLLVDDEADIRMVARLALESLGGYQVEECASGLEAPAAAARVKPQLILMDVMMPVQDGPTTFRALRAELDLPRIPVVFMTAKVQPQEVEALRVLGALDVIAKPFDPMTLSEQIREICARPRAV